MTLRQPVDNPWPFRDMRPLSYDFIMADPNWRFENYSAKGEGKNPTQHYHCDPLDVIKALPVGQLATKHPAFAEEAQAADNVVQLKTA